MKIVIIGAGGTGGVLGAYMAKAGNDITLIARGRHLAAMKENGLLLERSHGENILINPVKACTMDDYHERPDVILVCVKYYGIEDCIEFIRRVAGKETLVVPILNVYGTGRIMQERLPGITCLDGCMYVFGMIKEPGVISQLQRILRVFFGYRINQEHHLEDKARAFEKVLKDAEIDGHYTEHIERDALQKFSFVSPMGAAGLFFNAQSQDFQSEGEIRDFFKGMIAEVQAIGVAMGLEFKKDLVEIGLKLVDSYGPGGTTSMQRDVAAGGQSEFAGLVDTVVELGKTYDVPVPLYSKVSQWGKEKGIK